jgi:transcriptional regulator with XRE-family HTH domain
MDLGKKLKPQRTTGEAGAKVWKGMTQDERRQIVKKEEITMTEVDVKLATIRALIGAKDIKKKTLARRCKLTKSQFANILHGDSPLPGDVEVRLEKELGVSFGEESGHIRQWLTK